MPALSPPSSITLKSVQRTRSPNPTNRVSPSHRSDSTNAAANSLFCNSFSSTRADRQSACDMTGKTDITKALTIADLRKLKAIGPKALAYLAKALDTAPRHGFMLRVAFQGVPGAYSEVAARKAYPHFQAIPCDQLEVAFQSVDLWIADRAVLPVENSLYGSIHRNYDLLLRHRLHIVDEVQLSVNHCLLALPEVRKECVKRVLSHPQALAQCENTLTKLGYNMTREAVDDTAGAAEFVAANNLRDTAAIASSRAADLFGLHILHEGIQDDSSNVTRFFMLARNPIVPRTDRPLKTSIVFAGNGGEGGDRAGTALLFKVLSVFASQHISLTKIESRPVRVVEGAGAGHAKHFEYLFYIDFEASMADVRAQNAVAEVQEFTSFLRVLGSYPMDMTPWCPSGGD